MTSFTSMRRMEAATTQIAYDGIALRDGSMDVRDLAPALLAIGEVLDGANRVLNGDRASIAVKVKSDFKTGSFEIELMLVQTLAAQAINLFGGNPLKSAKEIAEYVGLITGADVSLLGLLKWLRGNTPQSTTTLANGKIEISVEVNGDNNKIVVSPELFQIANDVPVRQAAADVMRPLERAGVDEFQVRRGKQVLERVTKEDVSSFEVPHVLDREIRDAAQDRETLLEIIKPSFQDSLTWTFSDGSGGRFNARVTDQDFVKRVQSGERTFGKGDVVRVRVKSRPFITAEGLRTEHEVSSVLEEFNAPRQVTLLPRPKLKRVSKDALRLSAGLKAARRKPAAPKRKGRKR